MPDRPTNSAIAATSELMSEGFPFSNAPRQVEPSARFNSSTSRKEESNEQGRTRGDGGDRLCEAASLLDPAEAVVDHIDVETRHHHRLA